MQSILTPDDLKRGDLMEVGWKPAEIIKYEEKPADTDNSTNCIFHAKVLDGPDKGNQVKRLINEKALGFGKDIYAAVGLPKNANGGYNLSSEIFKAFEGKKVMIYVERGKSDKGNEYNVWKDTRPLDVK